jgi:rhamnogalacturonan endolyase
MRVTSVLTVLITVARTAFAKGPFLQQVTSSQWIIGNDIWNLTQGPTYATKLQYQGSDAVGKAQGHYAGVGTYTP